MVLLAVLQHLSQQATSQVPATQLQRAQHPTRLHGETEVLPWVSKNTNVDVTGAETLA